MGNAQTLNPLTGQIQNINIPTQTSNYINPSSSTYSPINQSSITYSPIDQSFNVAMSPQVQSNLPVQPMIQQVQSTLPVQPMIQQVQSTLPAQSTAQTLDPGIIYILDNVNTSISDKLRNIVNNDFIVNPLSDPTKYTNMFSIQGITYDLLSDYIDSASGLKGIYGNNDSSDTRIIFINNLKTIYVKMINNKIDTYHDKTMNLVQITGSIIFTRQLSNEEAANFKPQLAAASINMDDAKTMLYYINLLKKYNMNNIVTSNNDQVGLDNLSYNLELLTSDIQVAPQVLPSLTLQEMAETSLLSNYNQTQSSMLNNINSLSTIQSSSNSNVTIEWHPQAVTNDITSMITGDNTLTYNTGDNTGDNGVTTNTTNNTTTNIPARSNTIKPPNQYSNGMNRELLLSDGIEGFTNSTVKIPNTKLIEQQLLEEQGIVGRSYVLLYVWFVITIIVIYVLFVSMTSNNGYHPLANYVLIGISLFIFYYIFKNIF